MGSKKLHPSVEQFKVFVRERPMLAKEVKKGTYTLQELFEEWYLLGEDDPRWDSFSNEENGKDSKEKDKETKTSKGGWMNQIGGIIEKLDANQMQHHIHNLSQALASVQGVLSQFQGQQQNNQTNNTNNGPTNPFSFRKD